MSNALFTGVCTAMVTPFIHGRINYPMAELRLKRQIDSGIKAVVLAGTTGESPTLTDEEKLELFRRCKEYAGNHCKIIAGTGSNSTSHAVYLSKEAEKCGVDGLLLVSPYYNKSTTEGLYQHYLTIAHAVSIPIILYNVPTRTGVDIPVSVYARLSNIPNIVGVKEASGDITKITKIRNACRDNFTIWTGNDDQIVPVTALGGQGVISVVSNVFPEETQALYHCAQSGNFVQASNMQCKMQQIIDALFSEVNPIPVKAAMNMIGYDCGSCRLPLSDMSENKKEALRKLLS